MKSKKHTKSPNQVKVLDLLEKEGKVTLSMIQRNLNVSFLKSCELIIWLTDLGKLNQSIEKVEFYKKMNQSLF